MSKLIFAAFALRSFAKVFSNEDVAKDFLQDILKINIEKISVVSEATTQEDPFHKSVRFDVFVKEEKADDEGKPVPGRYFDIELQMEDTGELPKRARYYQGMCDLDALAKGINYDELREQYILFICPNDIFGKGVSVYSFQNRDDSDSRILMGDLCYKKFYIFKQYEGITDVSTREYMQYFATKKCESEKMKRIQHLVEKYRLDPIAKKAYMTFEQELNIRHKKWVEEGKKEGAFEHAKDTARRLLEKGKYSIPEIAEISGLSAEQIRTLNS